ncbi:hypothetical protein CASFOL_021453 [Castilleja foliolosa]|uniref:Uncharacterized protein n=1 Tax=Castilleja foliolosa TaxID=1961234 RepID=A0ABD3CZ93_9LAMI
MTPQPQPRRKKWTEAEERTLIDKYGLMACDGILSKMKTREKKYKPIALHVNSTHHARNPVLYPWQWTWKDVSTKVQNMRHQYVLVKQKIKKHDSPIDAEEFDWMEGITHWSNFLRYKEVFGDIPLVFTSNGNGGFEGGDGGHEMDVIPFGQDFVGGIENGEMGLEFEYEGDEGEENFQNVGSKTDAFICEDIDEPGSSDMRKKRKVLKGAWGFLVNQVGQLKEMEARFEQREAERELERLRRENIRAEVEKERERKWGEMEKERDKLRRQWIQELGVVKRENEERERMRREEELMHEREWEERLERRRSEWKKRMDEMMSQHRVEMGQVQARILHDQQNLTSQFIGMVSQWTGHPAGLSDHTGASGHYLSQMMQNLHHVNGMVHGDAQVEGDNQEDQFIVDG